MPGQKRNAPLSYAHRIAYLLSGNDIPVGMHVLHSCDNRWCCNPSHLRAGTNNDNVQDRVSRGREGDRRGAKNGRAKLSEDEVIAILSALASGENQAAIAERFGVAQSQVSNIKCGKQWAHISPGVS